MCTWLRDRFYAMIASAYEHLDKGPIMAGIQEVKDAIAQLSTDLSEAVDRVEAKLAESDVDLTAEVEALRSASAQLDSLAVDPIEPDPQPTDPTFPDDGNEPAQPVDPSEPPADDTNV